MIPGLSQSNIPVGQTSNQAVGRSSDIQHTNTLVSGFALILFLSIGLFVYIRSLNNRSSTLKRASETPKTSKVATGILKINPPPPASPKKTLPNQESPRGDVSPTGLQEYAQGIPKRSPSFDGDPLVEFEDQPENIQLDEDQALAILENRAYVRTLSIEQIENIVQVLSEAGEFKFSQLKNLSDQQILGLGPIEDYFGWVDIDGLRDTEGGTQSPFGQLFQNCPPDQLCKWTPFFGSCEWQCLSDEQILALDPEQAGITQDIFSAIRRYDYFFVPGSEFANFIQKCSLNKLHKWTPLFRLEHWKYLSDEQILSLDPEKDGITEDIFHFLSCREIEGGTFLNFSRIMQQFTTEQLYSWIPLFGSHHWSELSDEQILSLDFKKARVTKKIFASMRRTFDGTESPFGMFIQKRPSSELHKWIPLFSDEHWKCLSDEQLLSLDPEAVGVTKEIFRYIRGLFLFEDDDFAKFIQKCPPDELHKWTPLFNDEHWKGLSDEQILSLNPAQVGMTQDIFKGLRSRLLPKKGFAPLIQKFTVDQLYQWMPFFSQQHWQCLSDEQILSLDPKKAGMTQDIFKNLRGSLVTKKEFALVPQFTEEQLYVWLPFFSEKHWKHLTNEQIHRLNPTKAGITKEIFASIRSTSFGSLSDFTAFSRSCSSEELYPWMPFFSDDHWEQLSNKQILNLDPKRAGITMSIFEKMRSIEGGSSSPFAQLIRVATSEQIRKFEPFFSYEQWGISAQIKQRF